jgi:hypothetical protein
MIKFFRHIRQRLLSENKISKYLVYAMGEIVLVVIGILIALQINNWNDKKIQHTVDIEFITNLRNKIVLDTLALSSQLKWYRQINENTGNALALIDTSKTLNEEQTMRIGKSIAEAEYLLPVQKNIYSKELIVAAGSILRLDKNLHTDYLRYLEIIDFSYDLTTKLANALVTIVNDELYPSVDLNFTDETKNAVTFELSTLQNNRTVYNALQKSIYYRNAVIEVNKPLLERAKSIIDQIDTVLEKQ